MENKQELDTLNEIRNLMERSSRFISLSGLSGVFAGTYALLGAYFAYNYIQEMPVSAAETLGDKIISTLFYRTVTNSSYVFFFADALVVLGLSLITGFILTQRKAKKAGQKMWDTTAQRLIINLCIPLLTGGAFCMILLYHGIIGLIGPCMLIFYGLSLINASKYTLHDIRNLGLCEIVLGLICAFYTGHGLIFWALGFGVLHILYGIIMYYKYERE